MVSIVILNKAKKCIKLLARQPLLIEYYRKSEYLQKLVEQVNTIRDVEILEILDNLVLFSPQLLFHCWQNDLVFITDFAFPRLGPFQYVLTFQKVLSVNCDYVPYEIVNDTSKWVKNNTFGICFMMDLYWTQMCENATRDDCDMMPTYRGKRMTKSKIGRGIYYRNVVSLLAIRRTQLHTCLWNLVFTFLNPTKEPIRKIDQSKVVWKW